MTQVLEPGSEEDLAQAIREATVPFRIQGGGTRPLGTTDAETVLSTRALTGITLYEPGALTLVARAGTPLAEVEATLDVENQMLPFEPMDHRPLLRTSGDTPTIGGVMATNASGPRRVQVGAARDFALGIRFVDGAGNIVKNGGRVMKNVTGYDLVKLMAGARGTLGVLTEVAFKVLPKPDTGTTLRLEGLDIETAVAAMSAALASPFEVTGAAHSEEVGTLLRIEGFETSVEYRAEKLARHLGAFGTVQRLAEDGALWPKIASAEAFADIEGDVWRVCVRPSDAPRIAARLPDARLLLDWGGGLIWACVEPGTDLRAQMKGLVGHATLVRADDNTKRRLGVFHPEPLPLARLARGLRERFDPRALLNPGLMGSP